MGANNDSLEGQVSLLRQYYSQKRTDALFSCAGVSKRSGCDGYFMLGGPPYLSGLGQFANKSSVFRLGFVSCPEGRDSICFCSLQIPGQKAKE